jgi:hypothetical protein
MAYPIALDYDKWAIGCHLVPYGTDETGDMVYALTCKEYTPGGEVWNALDWQKPFEYATDWMPFVVILVYALLIAVLCFYMRKGDCEICESKYLPY